MSQRSRRNFLKLSTASLAGVVSADHMASALQGPIESSPTRTRPASSLSSVHVHPDGHLLQKQDGSPFFWLGDTAWQLIHATTREECSYYLHARARQNFTVIQTVVLSEMAGITTPSALGLFPFANGDPKHPNEPYFDRVAEIVDEAASLGLYVALVPSWGDKLTAPWGVGPRIFREDNLPDAEGYASYLAAKLKTRTNVLWMLGGDRPPRLTSEHPIADARKAGFPPNQDWTPIWRAFAAGLAKGGGKTPVILYHPQGGPESSSVFLHREGWLSVNGMQSGHGSGHDVPVWDWIARDYSLTPRKPTLDLEPNYEDHPYNPWPKWDPATGYFRDYDVRKQIYRSVFAGACGVTYGHHAVWQFANLRNGTINHADLDWINATRRPGGQQAQFLRLLIESRPFFSRIPDQSLIASDEGAGGRRVQATRDREGTYALIYIPNNDQMVAVDVSKLRSRTLRAWWYDPRTAIATVTTIPKGQKVEFRTPPQGPDWVLVLEDAGAGYPPPGEKLELSRG